MSAEAMRRARTCIGCRTQADKVGLLRIVRDPQGHVSFDETGRKAGRGAYVCSLKCLEDALRTKKLQRALKANVDQEDIERIADDIMDAVRMEDGA